MENSAECNVLHDFIQAGDCVASANLLFAIVIKEATPRGGVDSGRPPPSPRHAVPVL